MKVRHQVGWCLEQKDGAAALLMEIKEITITNPLFPNLGLHKKVSLTVSYKVEVAHPKLEIILVNLIKFKFLNI